MMAIGLSSILIIILKMFIPSSTLRVKKILSLPSFPLQPRMAEINDKDRGIETFWEKNVSGESFSEATFLPRREIRMRILHQGGGKCG